MKTHSQATRKPTVPTTLELLARVPPIPSSSQVVKIEPKASFLTHCTPAPSKTGGSMLPAEKDSAQAEAIVTTLRTKG
jgi:hypothetical protein